MYSDDTSCSDCKQERIEQRWTELLLHWLNRCVHPDCPVKELNLSSLLEIMNKYRQDICVDDIDSVILESEDVERFIKYKYPILRLRYFYGVKDIPKKIYIMTTIMLFHCCVNSMDGMVDSDICANLDKHEQEMVLKFCESLSDMEVTANNIECAIKDACEAVAPPPPRPHKKPESKKKSLSSELPTEISESYVTSSSPDKPSSNSMISETSRTESIKKAFKVDKFKSSVTVQQSVVTDTTSSSDANYTVRDTVTGSPQSEDSVKEPYESTPTVQRTALDKSSDFDLKRRCGADCVCSKCNPSDPWCGEPNSCHKCMSKNKHKMKKDDDGKGRGRGKGRGKGYGQRFNPREFFRFGRKCKICLIVTAIILLVLLLLFGIFFLVTNYVRYDAFESKSVREAKMGLSQLRTFQLNSYLCRHGICEKVFAPTSEPVHASLSRCILKCMGPQLWPYPIGYTYFSKKIATLATSRLEYKFQSVPSEAVHLYLAEAFKLFLGDLAKLERFSYESKRANQTRDPMVNKMYIQMDVESDPDPRIRLDTEESYTIKVETSNNQVTMKLLASSFCGMRHALETLSQLILLDQLTGYLITPSNAVIKDAPSYKYRGLMLDTGRNYIPVPDIMRTIDGMASCKLNTFHWRISDVTSFPLYLPAVPQLFEYGAYETNLIYTKDDIRAVVKRAGIRGIRVLLEVAAPGPVGRAWSWSPEASCPTKNKNYTCNNVLCLRLGIHDSVFDILQIIYSEILEMTQIEDVFHLSDSIFSLANCYYLIEEREGFLEKALERLKVANKGFLPKLPIIWYTSHLTRDYEAKAWDRFGVQLTEWQPNPSDQFLNRFKVIHSSRWDLSCEVKKQRCKKYRTWQDMYSWKSWRNIEVFTIEGGESMLWTDLVDTGNLDYHLWPRAAAVAERLWSDVALNGSITGMVYVRLDSHRWRMVLRSIQVQPIWPLYCSFSPGVCLQKLDSK